MSFTYTNQPGTVDIDTVRYEVDDKNETDALLTDEEIRYLIDSNRHILLAAAAAAETISARYSSDPQSKTVGDLTITYGSDAGRSSAYASMAKKLRNRAYRKAGASVYAGGISHGDKDTMERDTDRVQPSFTMGQMDHDDTDQGANTDRGVIDY